MSTGPAATRRVVLDSSVIFSRVLHEVFGRLALEVRLFDLVWSDELLAETKRVLIERKPVGEQVAERWVGYLRDAFPCGRIHIRDVPAGIELQALTRDADDEHVCALAVAAAPTTLVTFDEGFHAAALAVHGVEVVTPDELLVPSFEELPAAFMAILER